MLYSCIDRRYDRREMQFPASLESELQAAEATAITLDDYLGLIPKVEVHAHLIGSMRPATYDEFARAAGIDLPRPAAAFCAEGSRRAAKSPLP